MLSTDLEREISAEEACSAFSIGKRAFYNWVAAAKKAGLQIDVKTYSRRCVRYKLSNLKQVFAELAQCRG